MAVVSFDVWLISTNTVYRGVPFGAVTDWAQQGRLSPDDKIKDAGPGENWGRVADHPIVGDYLFVKSADAPPAIPEKPTEALEPVEVDVAWKKDHADDDDDPDMIPLIDISLVLLIFFMMTATVASMSPIKNPEMEHIANLGEDPEAFVIEIDRKPNGDPTYTFRIGNGAPEPGGSELPTMAEVLRVMDAKIAEMLPRAAHPPSVHVSCHEGHDSDKLLDLAAELEKRKRENKIRMFGTVVNEKPK